MLKFLLDEQIPPAVAAGFRRRHRAVSIHHLAEWEQGRCMGQTDEQLLHEASAQGLTLVTYDRKTVPPLLKIWAESGRDYGGVIFVDQKTISSSNFVGLIRALHQLWGETAQWHWTNRVLLLRR
jgi:hypothetical protein